jgi:hypothetical protein
MTITLIDRNEKEQRTAIKVLPKSELNGFDWAFVQGSTFVLRFSQSPTATPFSAFPFFIAT